MQTQNTSNGICSGVDRGPLRTPGWPPAWLKSADEPQGPTQAVKGLRNAFPRARGGSLEGGDFVCSQIPEAAAWPRDDISTPPQPADRLEVASSEVVNKQPVRRRLIGNGYPPVAPTVPAAEILVEPAIICSCCRNGIVVPELRKLTHGRCYVCWVGNSNGAHS
jgi:hypothetical protein